jgi:hypothetical protein
MRRLRRTEAGYVPVLKDIESANLDVDKLLK